jgi:8-oxo-dGTP pyrophosphatase MutT (NUDIX family)
MTAALQEAATLIVLRPGHRAPEILLVKRHHRMFFFPHAWVFPGGKVDAADREATAVGAVPGLAPEHRAHAIAAVRECREETGLAPCGEPPDLSRLRIWSWWVTPEVESRRYNTLFFVAATTAESEVALQLDELQDRVWITAKQALDRVAAENDPLHVAPPTFRTLEELAAYETIEDVLEAPRRIRPLMPRLDSRDDGGLDIVLPGDPSYPSSDPVEGPTRIRFGQGKWWSVQP